MALLRLVLQLERLHLVLEDVREGDQPALVAADAADVLDGGLVVFQPEDLGQELVVALLVAELVELVVVEGEPECKAGFGDVVGVVVVKGCGDYVLVLCVG